MTVRATHRAMTTRSKRLKRATRWVDLSGILDVLAPSERGQYPGRGRPVALGQLSIRGLLIALMDLVLMNRELSYAELTRIIWLEYTDEVLARIGLQGVRDPQTLEAMIKAGKPNATAADIRAGQLAEARARRRIMDAFERATTPINDNVLPANRRHTSKQLTEARATTDVSGQRAARLLVFNLIIQGSLYTANVEANERRKADKRSKDEGGNDAEDGVPFDPTDLRSGILADWTGDLAVDETDADHSIATQGRGKGLSGPDAHHPVSELAEFFLKDSSRLRWPNALGLTFAIAVSRPECRRVPAVALGGSIDKPSAASLAGALTAIDAIAHAGLRPAQVSNAHQYIVADMAYPHRTDWADSLLDRDYSQVVRYPRNAPRILNLTASSDPTGPSAATLFNGVPICPGMSAAALKQNSVDVPTPEDFRGDITRQGRLLDKHEERLRRVLPLVMVRHGRPVRTPNRPPGRPRSGVPDPENVYRMRVVCPAIAGQAMCPLVPDSMNLDPKAAPLVPDPPIDAPPATCRSSFTKVQLTHSQFRHYQPRMHGSWEHEDFYTSARSRNEGFHAALLHKSTGGLGRGTIHPWKNAFLTIALAMCVGATNFHILDNWNDILLLNGGRAPYETHRKKHRARQNAIAYYRANRQHLQEKD